MGTNVIGLDIGTNAVRAVELSLGRGQPVVKRMGQVTLPPGAVVAGEVIDSVAVSSSLRRLWKEGGFVGKQVVVGVANPRVVARVADLPAIPDHELRASLPYQVQDLIPIPVEDAELDVHVIERDLDGEGDGERMVRVLLVAAHRDMLRSLLAALDGAGLTASRIDLIPFALIRALHDPSGWLSDGEPLGGQEVIIGSGAGVTNVVVHENGVPRFVRTLPTGGSAVTEALAVELGIGGDDAEAVKRGVGAGPYAPDQPHVDDVARDSLLPLAHEVAGSLDFHLAQIGHGELRRVVVSGGAGRLGSLRKVLQDQLGVPVVDGTPYTGLDLSKVPLEPAVVARSGDLFAVAIGLALSAAPTHGDIRRISLLPATVAAKQAERAQIRYAAVGVGALAAVLAGLTLVRGVQIASVEDGAQRAEDQALALDGEVAGLSEIAQLQQSIAVGGQTVTAALTGDIAWTGVLRDVNKFLPADVSLTSFTGTSVDGAVQLAAEGRDHTSSARMLQGIEAMSTLQAPWLQSSSETDRSVGIAATAHLGEGAPSTRAANYLEGER